jgi:hypothetical protein
MLKLACLILLCAIVAVQCQDGEPFSKPGEEDSQEEETDSSEEYGGFEKRPQTAHGKNGKFQLALKGDGNNNDDGDDVNVNVNVRIGSPGLQRPQRFGDRPLKGRPNRGGYNGKPGEHYGGKRPGPSRPEIHGPRPDGERRPRPQWNGSRPDGERPPRPQWNGSRPDGERPARPEWNGNRPGGKQPGGNDHDYYGHGGKYGRGGKDDENSYSENNEQDNSDNNDVNVNVNVQISRGNSEDNYPQRGGYGGRRPQIGGEGNHHGNGEGGRRPPKPEGYGRQPAPGPEDNVESSSEQNE